MIALIISVFVPLAIIASMVAAKVTKLLLNSYADENLLIFSKREEKILCIAVIIVYVLGLGFFVVFHHESGYDFLQSLYYAVQSCVVFTVLPPFGFFALGLIFLMLKNRKRKRRQTAVLTEGEKAKTPEEETPS